MKVKTLIKSIRKFFKNIFDNRFITLVLIPSVLLLLAILFSGFSSLTYNASYTVLPQEHNPSKISPSRGDLYAGQTLRGEFVAKENNLGAVAIRLHNFNGKEAQLRIKRVPEDEIIFRFKEKNSNKWYYEHVYSGGQFHELEYFPFGFIPIADSKNKSYVFEIYSRNGEEGNVLSISNKQPHIITQYQFNRQELIGNNDMLIDFVLKKMIYAFSHLEFYFVVFIFLLPFVFHFIWISFLKEYLSAPFKRITKKMSETLSPLLGKSQLMPYLEEMTIFDVLIIVGLIFDILFIEHSNVLITITLLLLWLFNVLVRKVDSTPNFGIALVFLIICPILYAFTNEIGAEKAAVWVILFLIFGAVHTLFQLPARKI